MRCREQSSHYGCEIALRRFHEDRAILVVFCVLPACADLTCRLRYNRKEGNTLKVLAIFLHWIFFPTILCPLVVLY